MNALELNELWDVSWDVIVPNFRDTGRNALKAVKSKVLSKNVDALDMLAEMERKGKKTLEFLEKMEKYSGYTSKRWPKTSEGEKEKKRELGEMNFDWLKLQAILGDLVEDLENTWKYLENKMGRFTPEARGILKKLVDVLCRVGLKLKEDRSWDGLAGERASVEGPTFEWIYGEDWESYGTYFEDFLEKLADKFASDGRDWIMEGSDFNFKGLATAGLQMLDYSSTAKMYGKKWVDMAIVSSACSGLGQCLYDAWKLAKDKKTLMYYEQLRAAKTECKNLWDGSVVLIKNAEWNVNADNLTKEEKDNYKRWLDVVEDLRFAAQKLRVKLRNLKLS